MPNPEITEEQKALYRSDPDLLEAEYKRLSDQANYSFAAAIVGANPKVLVELTRLCTEHLETAVTDPELRARLTPDYPVGCKRLVMNHGFYQALQQPNAELLTSSIDCIEPQGVRTKDGVLHELDILVLATGFDTHRFMRPMNVVAPDGRTLDDMWSQSNQAYLGVTVPGLANWFMIDGPNSPIGNFSWLLTAENQFAYAMQLIDLIRTRKANAVMPKAEASAAFNAALKDKIPDTVWAQGCTSWYIDKSGNVASWPWTYDKFVEDMAAPVLENFELR